MDRLARLRTTLLAHPRWLAPALGGAAACGFAPLSLWPVTLVALAGLIALVGRARGVGGAALIGWLFGVAHFAVGLNWIATAFTFQSNMPAWLGWVAVVGLSFYLAVYPAMATTAAWWITRAAGGIAAGLPPPIGVVLAACWVVTEWLRAVVFTGFAWNPLGAVLLGGPDGPGLAVLAPLIGTYGLSGLAVALGALLHSFPGGGGWRAAPRALIGAGVMLVMIVPFGFAPRDGGDAFTLVQPDIRQEVLNAPSAYGANFARLAALSRPTRAGPRRLVLWPESGLPDYLRDGYPRDFYDGTTYAGNPALARARIARVLGPGAVLLTGAVDLDTVGDRAVGARNVVTALDDRGAIVGSYAKAHLVPFGEYLALRWLLEPLGATRLVPGSIDFLPGPGPRTLDLGPFGRAGIQICYEITFSGQVVDRAHRPDFLFNPSNDGWFGAWGPPQHLAQARLRAIEEGLPVLRATTTGISAVIGADGVVVDRVPRLVAGRIDGTLPRPLTATPFARIGNALPLALAAALLVIYVVALRRRRR